MICTQMKQVLCEATGPGGGGGGPNKRFLLFGIVWTYFVFEVLRKQMT
jgi:hypothetical protein